MNFLNEDFFDDNILDATDKLTDDTENIPPDSDENSDDEFNESDYDYVILIPFYEFGDYTKREKLPEIFAKKFKAVLTQTEVSLKTHIDYYPNQLHIERYDPQINVYFKFNKNVNPKMFYLFAKFLYKVECKIENRINIYIERLKPTPHIYLHLYYLTELDQEKHYLEQFFIIATFKFFGLADKYAKFSTKKLTDKSISYEEKVNSFTKSKLDYSDSDDFFSKSDSDERIIFYPVTQYSNNYLFYPKGQLDTYVKLSANIENNWLFPAYELYKEFQKNNSKTWNPALADIITINGYKGHKAIKVHYYCWTYYKVFHRHEDSRYDVPGFILYYRRIS